MDEESQIQQWQNFSYRIYKHTGWLTRRHDVWSYAGNAAWSCRISLDLDFGSLKHYFEECFPADSPCATHQKSGSNGASMKDRDATFRAELMTIPLIEMRKTAQFLAVDLLDSLDCSMHLLTRAQSAHYCVGILAGALRSEPPILGDSSPSLQLDINEFLAYAIEEWFRRDSFPIDDQGTIDPFSNDCQARIEKAFLNDLNHLARERNRSNEALVLDEGRFRTLFNHSVVFRYFICNFAFKWLVCTSFFPNENNELLKFEYVSTRDTFGHGESYGFSNLLGAYMNFFILDNVGFAEISHTTIVAPPGLRFSPTPKILRGSPESTEEHFAVIDRPEEWATVPSCKEESLADNKGSTKENQDPPATMTGSLTPGYVHLKVLMPWVDDKRIRRIPTNAKQKVHRYSAFLALRPKLGMQSAGQIAFVLFSVFFFAMLSFDSVSLFGIGDSDSNDSSNGVIMNLLMIITPIAIAAVTVRDEASYMRKLASRFSRGLVKICAVLDGVGFTALWILSLLSHENTQLIPISKVITLGLFVACLILLITLVVWTTYLWHSSNRWVQKPGACAAFSVPVLDGKDA